MYKKFYLKTMLLLCALIVGGNAWADNVTDELTNSTFGVTGTTYTLVKNKRAISDAVYTANLAGGNNSIQLRSSNSNSGIVSTTSGGKLVSVSIEFNENTTSGRTVTVYGSNKAFTDPSELYGINANIEELGRISTTSDNKTITVSGDYKYVGIRSQSGALYLDKVIIGWSVDENAVATTTTIDDSGITNTDVYAGATAGSLSATVSAGGNAISGASVSWSSSNTDVATIDENGAVTLVSAGTTTITASYAGVTDQYQASSATYEMTVTNTDPNAPGTENNPYTVAQAIEYINTLGTSTSPNEVYVSGIISQVNSYNSNYKSITYWISDDGTTSTQMQVYSGKGLNGADFASKDDLQVDDIVTVKGFVKTYSDTPEFDKNNYLVSFERPASTEPSISVANNNINVTAEGGEGTINVTYTNFSDVSADVAFYKEDGTTAATYDWITAEINDDNNIEYLIDANAGAARTAYMKVWAYDDDLNEVYSDLITITQAAPVIDYATLPFSFNGKKEDIEGTTGLTQSGLGNNYAVAPFLKFDSTGDYAILKFNERPGVLTFDIKGNSFSGGTFKVQTSVDGTTFTDLESYTELGETKSESFDNLAADVRYIKWIYTEKVSGNVALGNINLEAAASTATITLNAACTDGTLIYGTYYSDKAYVMNDMLEGQVVRVDADGKLVVETAYEGGEVVPAYTALLIATADEFTGTKEYTITLSTGGDDWSEFNMLKGTLTADEMTTGDNCLFYRLTMHKGTQIGFWWGADNGGAFKPGANKAYLAVPANQAKDGFAFGNDGDATEIVLNALKGEQNGEMYNLQGQKVGSEYKGIVIVNGKKFINK